ncbi:MAG: prepilin-type N-terminal cleavage/methylation domain-containing protein [candidate division Zixibacteria bacterium]|nr:prepilin-type N-terminal cleavage/methylation domain-containing protein [candidate division Zixibacteria bacterium]
MGKISNNKGVTLIELLISALISSVVISSAMSLYLTQHKQMIVQDQISDMQHNIRASIQELGDKIKMAGYNVPSGMDALLISNADPDTIEIFYDSEVLDGVSINHAMPQPSAELRCDGDLSGLEDGNWIYIYDPFTQTGEFFEISHVQAAAGHIQHNTMALSRCYPVGSLVIRMNGFKYYIDNTTDSQHPKLMIARNHQQPQIYADNIIDLQFRYVLSSGAIVDVPPIAEMIREVIINVSARTDRADNEFETPYRTRALQTRVKVRNLGIG